MDNVCDHWKYPGFLRNLRRKSVRKYLANIGAKMFKINLC